MSVNPNRLFTVSPIRPTPPSYIPDDVPVYMLGEGGLWAEEELHPEGKVISYLDEPNERMIPLNDLAMEKMRAFLTKCDEFGRDVAKEKKTAFISQLDAFNRQYGEDVLPKEKRISVISNPVKAPIMGGGKKQRGRPRINKIDVDHLRNPNEVKPVGRRSQDEE